MRGKDRISLIIIQPFLSNTTKIITRLKSAADDIGAKKRKNLIHRIRFFAEEEGLEPPQGYPRRFSRPLQYHYAIPPCSLAVWYFENAKFRKKNYKTKFYFTGTLFFVFFILILLPVSSASMIILFR